MPCERRERENARVESETLTSDDQEAYAPRAPFRDELFDAEGTPRPAAGALIAGLARLGREGLTDAGRRRDAIFLQQGITFETTGDDGPVARTAVPARPRAAHHHRSPSGTTCSRASRSGSAR